MNLEIGQVVRCATCGKTKKPIGRDAGIAEDSFCVGPRMDGGCVGYWEDPKPGDLWPGERRGEIGPERRDAWLPIESAPRDGSVIIVAKYGGTAGVVRWKSASWISATWVDCVFMAAEVWQPLLAAPEAES